MQIFSVVLSIGKWRIFKWMNRVVQVICGNVSIEVERIGRFLMATGDDAETGILETVDLPAEIAVFLHGKT